MSRKVSGAQQGVINVQKLKDYLETLDVIPERNGKAHMSAIALGAELDRQVLYKNPAVKALLDEHIAKKGLKPIATVETKKDTTTVKLERELAKLEKKNAALVAENYNLRRENAKLELEEIVRLNGRHIPS